VGCTWKLSSSAVPVTVSDERAPPEVSLTRSTPLKLTGLPAGATDVICEVVRSMVVLDPEGAV
jgi:hypothetical protein